MRYPYDTSYRDGHSLLRYPGTRIVYGMLMLVLLVAPWVLPRYFVGEVTYVFIMCVVSLGLMVLVGYTGQVSLGHSAFVAIGAYAHAWLLAQGVPLVVSLALAACITGAVGWSSACRQSGYRAVSGHGDAGVRHPDRDTSSDAGVLSPVATPACG
jgi:branched-chain amino acid transport system permease protein